MSHHRRIGRGITVTLVLLVFGATAACGSTAKVASTVTTSVAAVSAASSTTLAGSETVGPTTAPAVATTTSTATTATATTATAPTPATPPAPGGCSPGRPAASGVSNQTILVGGQARSYLVSVPPGYDGHAAVPVVFTFHGLGSNDRQQLAYSGFGTLGDTDDFIVVAPQARGRVAAWDFTSPVSDPTSDGAFVAALVRSIDSTYCVDADRQYASGISNGSAVTFALACTGQFPFAAYGGVAGAFFRNLCPAGPTAIIYFQGTADPLVPIDGGRTVGGNDIPPIATTMQQWATHDGCAASPTTTTVAGDVTEQRWTGCQSSSEVDYYVIAGGGHTWPGASSIGTRLLGPTTQCISATNLMWAFFEAHPKR